MHNRIYRHCAELVLVCFEGVPHVLFSKVVVLVLRKLVKPLLQLISVFLQPFKIYPAFLGIYGKTHDAVIALADNRPDHNLTQPPLIQGGLYSPVPFILVFQNPPFVPVRIFFLCFLKRHFRLVLNGILRHLKFFRNITVQLFHADRLPRSPGS